MSVKFVNIPTRRCCAYLWLMAMLFNAGCALPYYKSAVAGHLRLLHARVPIEQALDSEDLTAEQKQKLELFIQARQFAHEHLYLPDNQSYSHYVALDRPYVVWNLVATPEFSLTPESFCFLVVGCLDYKGYFVQADAHQQADRLHKLGYDVSVTGVRAYSTLGWSADPLLSTQLDLPDWALISVLFHELAHQKLYVKNDTAFNEAFAQAVAYAGMQLWFEQKSPSHMEPKYTLARKQSERIHQALRQTRLELQQLYATSNSEINMRQTKQDIFENFKQNLKQLQVQYGDSAAIGYWLNLPLNNAHFALEGTYYHWQPVFLKLWHESEDLAQFYRACEDLAGLRYRERQDALNTMLDQAMAR